MNDTTNQTSRFSLSQLIPHNELYVLMTVYLTVCFAGSVSNLFTTLAIFSSKAIGQSCGYLIGHCMIPCTLLCAVIYPLIIIVDYRKIIHNQSITLIEACLISWFQMTFYCAMVWIELCIALNRLVAICFPHYYRRFATTRWMNSMVICAWLIGGVNAVFGFFGVGVKYGVSPLGNPTYYSVDATGVFFNIVRLYLPYSVTFLFYIITYAKLSAVKRRRQAEISDRGLTVGKGVARKGWNRRLRTAHMMFVAFLWNGLCSFSIPIYVALMPEAFGKTPIVLLWISVVVILGYVLNPIIFCGMNKDYKKAIVDQVASWKTPFKFRSKHPFSSTGISTQAESTL